MINIPLTVTPKSGGNDLISWTAVSGVGSYRLMRDGKWISSSYDGAKTTWLVKRGQTYELWAYGAVIAQGSFPSGGGGVVHSNDIQFATKGA